MDKKQPKKKLRLNRETVKLLSNSDLEKVAGGKRYNTDACHSAIQTKCHTNCCV